MKLKILERILRRRNKLPVTSKNKCEGAWFDTGLLMNDSNTKRLVYAKTSIEVCEFKKKGFKEVKGKVKTTKVKSKKKND